MLKLWVGFGGFDRKAGQAAFGLRRRNIAGAIVSVGSERKDQDGKSKNDKSPVEAGERHVAALSSAGKLTQKL